MHKDLTIILQGDEADRYILLRNEVNALAVQAKATAKKVHLAVANLNQLAK